MQNISYSAFITLSLLLMSAAPAVAESIPQNPVAAQISNSSKMSSEEIKLSLDAAGKLTDILTAQLEGNQEKVKQDCHEAISLYDKILAINPNNVKAINGRGAVNEILAQGSGAADYNRAIELSSAAIATNPKDGNAYFNRATAYRGLKKYDAARIEYNKAIELNPERADWPLALRAMETEAK